MRRPPTGSCDETAPTRRRRNRQSRISPKTHAMLGAVPTQETLMLERFFDESGGMRPCSMRRRQPSTRRGAWRCAAILPAIQNSELQAAATEERCCCRSGRSTRSRLPTSSAPPSATAKGRVCRRCSTRRCSRRGGAGTPRFRSRSRGSAARLRCPQPQRMQAEDLMAPCFRMPRRVWKHSRRPPDSRSPARVAGRFAIASRGAVDFDGLARAC